MLWAALGKKLRNIIRTTSRHAEVQESRDFDRFLRLSRAELRPSVSTHDYATLQRIYEAADQRGQAMLRCAVTESGVCHSGCAASVRSASIGGPSEPSRSSAIESSSAHWRVRCQGYAGSTTCGLCGLEFRSETHYCDSLIW